MAVGASAAAKARRTSEAIEITLLEAAPYISFANCGLPYYVGGEIQDRQRLFVTSADQFSRRFNVDANVNSRAVEIRARERTVEVSDEKGCSESIEYDRLVVATGIEPVSPRIPELSAGNIFNVRTVPDVDAVTGHLERLVDSHRQVRPVVVGGGRIGLEMAEQPVRLGYEVTLLELAEQVMLAMDPEMALPVEDALTSAAVCVSTGDGPIGIEHSPNGASTAVTTSRLKMPFDIAIIAIGVRPAGKLAD